MKEINVYIDKSPILPCVNMIKDKEDCLEITVFNGETQVEVKKAKIDGKKPFGEHISIYSKIENGIIVAELTPEDMDQTGKILCEITIKEEKAYFYIYVEDIRE